MKSFVLFLTGLISLPAIAPAQEQLTLGHGTWSLQSYVAFAGANDELMPSLNLGVGYHVIDDLSLNVEGAGFGILQDGEDAGAGEIRLLMRHHVIKRGRCTIFADVGEGFLESSARVPENGTRLNFIFRAGAGMSCQLRDNLFLLAGVRYFHISNADLEGDARNPAINGIEGYAGLMWTFH